MKKLNERAFCEAIHALANLSSQEKNLFHFAFLLFSSPLIIVEKFIET